MDDKYDGEEKARLPSMEAGENGPLAMKLTLSRNTASLVSLSCSEGSDSPHIVTLMLHDQQDDSSCRRQQQIG